MKIFIFMLMVLYNTNAVANGELDCKISDANLIASEIQVHPSLDLSVEDYHLELGRHLGRKISDLSFLTDAVILDYSKTDAIENLPAFLKLIARHDPRSDARDITLARLISLRETEYAVAICKDLLFSTDPMKKISGLKALASLEDESLVPYFEGLLFSKSDAVQAYAVYALGAALAMDSLPLIRYVSAQGGPEVKTAALQQQSKLDIEYLMKRLEDIGQIQEQQGLYDLLTSALRLGIPINQGELLLQSSRWEASQFYSGFRPIERLITRSLKFSGYYSSKSNDELIELSESSAQTIAVGAISELANRPQEIVFEHLKKLANSERWAIRTCAQNVLYLKNGDFRYHTLYSGIKDDGFFVHGDQIPISKFKKSGTEIFLLGGRLAGKVIARRIPRVNINKWEQARNRRINWSRSSIGYNPIEKIISLKDVITTYGLTSAESKTLEELSIANSNEESALVFAAVIPGLSMKSTEDWILLGPFNDQDPISAQHKVIKRNLLDAGILHGHTHKGNFVVNGQKLYVIDFDESR